MNLKAIPPMLAMIPSVMKGMETRDLQKVKKLVRAAFPGVKQVSCETLTEWLASANPAILLIDVRPPEEFEVSHLRHAVNLQTWREIAQTISDRRPAKTVLYCSVGFRSSQLAQRLRTQIAADVYNLEGSIFEWANQGRPVYRGEIPVRQIHPYGKHWAGLLLAGLASKT